MSDARPVLTSFPLNRTKVDGAPSTQVASDHALH
jgi:hypothetical protein